MKKKKIITGTLSLLMGISLLSVVANAETVGYSIQMPAKGSVDTDNSAKKADTDKKAHNTVDDLGWVDDGDGFQWWIINPDDGKALSNTMTFSSTGRYNTSYKGSNAKDYKGWELKMRMKTDLITSHECDVNGRFTP